MSNMKKVAVSASAAAVAGLMMIGGASILAYLTDEEKTVNTFTVGRVNVDLEEPNYPGNDSASVKNLVPNEEVNKDPQSENTGENDLISYIAYDIPVVLARTAGTDGTREAGGEKHPIELFKTIIKNNDGSEVSVDNAVNKGVHDSETTPASLATDHETDHMAGNWISLGDVEYYTVKTLKAGDSEVGQSKPSGGSYVVGDKVQTKVAAGDSLNALTAALNAGTASTDATNAYNTITNNGALQLVARRTYGYSLVVPGTVEADAAAANAADPAAESKKLRTTKPIFDSVKMANIIEDEIPGGAIEDITVYNYAIQASNIEGITGAEANNTISGGTGIKGGEAVPASATGTKDAQQTLKDAFDVYIRQQDADAQNIGTNAASYTIDSAEVASAKDLKGQSAGEIYHTVSISTDDKRIAVGNGPDKQTRYTVKVFNNTEEVTTFPTDKVTVTSADPAIATVAADTTAGQYIVSAVAPGQTQIKAVYDVGSGNKAEAVLDVIVYPDSIEGHNAAATGVDHDGLPLTDKNSPASNQKDSEGELNPPTPNP